MAFNVKVTKASLKWEDPTLQYPYVLHMEGTNVDTLDPISLEATNVGLTADVDIFISDTETAEGWTVVN